MTLRVVHASATEAVVVKPSGLSSESPHGVGDSALAQARKSLGWPEARLPHRLDRVTRGFLLIARDAASAAFHAESIRARRWTKGYLARLDPSDRADVVALRGTHRRYLTRRGRRAECVRSGGDPAFLDILTVAAAPSGHGLDVAIHLLTGRFHQIRAVCADLGAPLWGDALYGSTRTDEPVLEHAVLRFPMPDGGVASLWEPDDPDRRPVAAAALAALADLAASSLPA